MLLKRTFFVAGAMLLVTSLIRGQFNPLHPLTRERATVRVTEGKNACSEIHFPNCWKTQDGQCADLDGILFTPGLNDTDSYEFRQRAGWPSEILIGLQYFPLFPRSPSQRKESPDRYVVTLAQHGAVRKASEEEWTKATPLAEFVQTADLKHAFIDIDNDRPLQYGGKWFAKSGPRWPRIPDEASRRSANGEYLAIQSWDGKEMDCPFVSPCKSFGGGHYWEDVYEVKAGRRLVAVTGQFWLMTSDTFFNIAGWVGDRYFIRPLQKNLQSVLICDMNAAAKPHRQVKGSNE